MRFSLFIIYAQNRKYIESQTFTDTAHLHTHTQCRSIILNAMIFPENVDGHQSEELFKLGREQERKFLSSLMSSERMRGAVNRLRHGRKIDAQLTNL